MGDFKVHRVRFFDYMPSGIRCMAFNHKTHRLALARLDGSVEIFNFSDNFFQEKIIPGKDSQSIEAICWVGERLFTASLNGGITEHDLVNLRPKYSLDAFGGPIWTLACNAQGTHIAVGCEDGSVKLFEVHPENIQFERNLDRQKGRVMSLSWHTSGAQIAAGMLDMIRVFDVKSVTSSGKSYCAQNAGGSRRRVRRRKCVVWSVVFLSDHTIVSGDSAGKVQVWDGNMGTLIKTHQISKWDVLCLSASQDENSLVAGTSEGTVVQFQFLASTLVEAEKEWVRTRTLKPHTHDVRAVLELEQIIVSGGMDTQLVVRPLMDKVEIKSQDTAPRKIHFPHRRLVSCAEQAGLLLFQFPAHLEVWRLGESDGHGRPGDRLLVRRKPEKLLQLKRKGEEQISCSALSNCGGWVAYSSVSSLRLFRLQCDNNHLSIVKISSLPKFLSSAHQLCFSADSSKLFVASSNSTVHVISLSKSECKLVHSFKSASGCTEPVHLLAPSADGAWLATANGACEIHIYNLHKLKPHCSLPLHRSCPSAMAIHPTTNNLVVVHADQQIFEFSVVEGRYTDWSRKLQRVGLHPLWLQRDTPVTHVTFNLQNPAQFLLHDMYMFCLVDQSLPLPEQRDQFFNQLTLKSLSEDERKSRIHAFKICKRFQPLLSMFMLKDGALVVVERPLLDITTQLPAPIGQKKFAT
ncbi:hypothetical protein AGOR_G00007080 [Albula goreensis]|uniref:Cirhin n=1 Tax=Albula goreensis TaxID=1534307 RepID=A0A8T3E566_9TELE|nr:hypothetical protein AGOR_G00007080 [Albula goreensis]